MSRLPPSAFLQPWRPGQPVEARRLEAIQASSIGELRVSAPLRLIQHGRQITLQYIPEGLSRNHLKAKLTSGTLLTGYFNRWRYTWTEQRPVKEGRWEDVPGGMTNATPEIGGYAYNLREANNTNAGLQGNGINLATLPAGFTIQAATGIVTLERIQTCEGDTEWYFEYENAVQGACP